MSDLLGGAAQITRRCQFKLQQHRLKRQQDVQYMFRTSLQQVKRYYFGVAPKLPINQINDHSSVISTQSIAIQHNEGVKDISMNFVKVFDSIANQKFVINVTLNQKNFLYKITAIFLMPKQSALKVQCKETKKSICRDINLLNSSITYGSYFFDMDKSTIGFRIIKTKTPCQYQQLLNNPKFLNENIEKDLYDAIQASLRIYTTKIITIIQNSVVKNHNVNSTQIDTNYEHIKSKSRCQGIVKRSGELNKQKSIQYHQNQKAITQSTQLGNKQLPIDNQTYLQIMEQDVHFRQNLLEAQFKSANQQYLQGPKLRSNNLYERQNIASEIVPCELNKANWQPFSYTNNSELYRHKQKFQYKVTAASNKNIDLNNKQRVINKIVVIKIPLASKRDHQDEVKKIARQKNIIMLMTDCECANIAKYYYTKHSKLIMNPITTSPLMLLQMLIQLPWSLRFLKNIHIAPLDIKNNNLQVTKCSLIKISDLGKAQVYWINKKRTNPNMNQMEDHTSGYLLSINKNIKSMQLGHNFIQTFLMYCIQNPEFLAITAQLKSYKQRHDQDIQKINQDQHQKSQKLTVRDKTNRHKYVLNQNGQHELIIEYDQWALFTAPARTHIPLQWPYRLHLKTIQIYSEFSIQAISNFQY